MAKIMIRGVGLIGSLFVEKALRKGTEITIVSRDPARFRKRDKVTVIDRKDVMAQVQNLATCDVVINLEGKNIAAGLWTRRLKQEILQSRIDSVAHLAEILKKAQNPQIPVIQASATGYYGDRASEILTEAAEPGTGFLADTCVAWESAALKAFKKNQLQIFRIAPVLSRTAGVFVVWRRVFRSFMGGRLGKGDQYFSWIHEHDVAELLLHYAQNFVPGIVNATAPEPVKNESLTRILAQVFSRPGRFTVPQFILEKLPGDFGKEMLLASVRAVPKRALADGFEFSFNRFEEAAQDLAI